MRYRSRLLAGLILLALLVPGTGVLATGGADAVNAGLPDVVEDFRLGNTDLNIHNGGIMAQDGDTLYYVEDGAIYRRVGEGAELLITDNGSNLNVGEGVLRYTVQTDEGWVLRALHLDTGRVDRELVWTGGKINQLFMVNGDTAYFLSGGSLYAWYLTEGRLEALADRGDIVSFIPTEYGLIYATGSRFDAELYVGGRSFATGISSYYIDSGHLVAAKDGGTWQIALDTLFAGAGESALAPLDLHDHEDEESGLSAYGVDGDCAVCQANLEAYLNGSVSLEDYGGETVSTVRAMSQISAYDTPAVSQGQRNIIKRARQMHEVEWTPLADRYVWGGASVFSAGTTYTGLPYGQPVYTGYVGYTVSLSGFVDAVNNHDSSFYSGYSEYNKIAPYYSADCSSFVSYAWGLTTRRTTYSLLEVSTKVGDQSVYSAQIGDAFNRSSSHIVLVYDIKYDSEGNMVAMAILEETPPITKLTWYGSGYSQSLADLQSRYIGGGYVLYRYPDRDSVTYTPTSAVSIDGDSSYLAAPKISVTGQARNMQVTLSAASGATIYYTTDGSNPTTSSAVYSGPFTLGQNTKVKAVAVSGGVTSSTLTYNVTMATAEKPVASVGSGTVVRGSVLTLTSATAGAEIYYTTDGSAPSENSGKYSGGITIDRDMTVRAIAVASNMAYSDELTLTYTAVDGVIITATAETGGSISPSGTVTLFKGGSQTFTITPDSQYEIADVLVNGVSVGAVSSYTFTNATEDGSITAKFTRKENPFIDVDRDEWYYQAVVYVYQHGIFNGESDTIFAPDRDITRAEFVTALGRMAGVDVSGYTSYTATITGTNVYFRSGPGTGYSDYGYFPTGATLQVIGQSGVWYQVIYNGQTGWVSDGSWITVSGPSFSDVAAGVYYTGYVEWAAKNGIVTGVGNGRFAPDDQLNREQMCLMMYNYATYMGISLPAKVSSASFDDSGSISSWAADAVAVMQRAGLVNGTGDGRFYPQSTATRAQVATILMNFDQM